MNEGLKLVVPKNWKFYLTDEEWELLNRDKPTINTDEFYECECIKDFEGGRSKYEKGKIYYMSDGHDFGMGSGFNVYWDLKNSIFFPFYGGEEHRFNTFFKMINYEKYKRLYEKKYGKIEGE